MNDKSVRDLINNQRDKYAYDRLHPKPVVKPENPPRSTGGALDVISRHTPTKIDHNEYLRAKSILKDSRKRNGMQLSDDEHAVLRRDMFYHI